MIGARLGPYEVTAALGAGGMGEVFRAKDAKLGREVAIKVLQLVEGRRPAFAGSMTPPEGLLVKAPSQK